MDARTELAESLGRRYPTHMVAGAILRLGLRLPRELRTELEGLATHWLGGASMSDDFDRPAPVSPWKLQTYERLFPDAPAPWATHPSWPDHLRRLVSNGMIALHFPDWLEEGAAEALHARAWTTGAERKRLRFLRRLEQRAARLDDAWRLRRAQMQAKSRLAYAIEPVELDDLGLAFCAYLAARANRRSQFLFGPQSRAVDTIVEGLETLLRATHRPDDGAWDQVALVRPTPDVLGRCRPEARGRLIGAFHAAMTDSAAALRDLYPTLPERMRAEMVMVRGVDSSRWNAYAGALNSMRSAWLNATLACGLDVRGEYLPGKAPRLMASDVAWMHRNAGGDLHEDTTLFAALPKPWEVVLGGATLDRRTIEAKARDLGVDVSTGWTGPRRGEAPERPEPDPDLVHGIAVSDPRLAKTLRRCRVFSGKEHRFIDELPEDLLRVETSDGRRTSFPVIGAAEREPSRERA